ncbi:signal peptidase I [Candidatus Woesearchaeota archaeon]|nr:signal peptidase I [Candidatus Woesearchaeota archaeon]
MQHQAGFDMWWKSMESFYEKHNISKEEFTKFRMSTGFNKGDIIILKGKKPEDVSIGDVIVFKAGSPEPIIHRVVSKWESQDKYYFATKGDRNAGQRDEEKEISQDRILGKGWLRVPYVGYVKIIFTDIVNSIRG